MDEAPSPIQLAERVDALARSLGIETVVIGAFALAAHNYVRGTEDLDLAATTSLSALRALETSLRAEGLSTALRTPDNEDPLGGVLVVWQRVDEDDEPVEPVEVVNFTNPYRPRRTPATSAIRNALSLEGSTLRYPRLDDLVALKLHAGAPRDEVDVVEMLACNPDANLDEIRATCASYGLGQIERLIADAEELRRRRRR